MIEEQAQPRYNIAPTTTIDAVADSEGKQQ